MDYRTEAHTVVVNMSYQILPSWNITTDMSYTLGRGNITDLEYDSMYPTGDVKLDYDTTYLNPDMPHLYDVAYLNNMDKYSDADYSQVDLTVGTSYRFDSGVGIGLNYYFTHFSDEDPLAYYGDQGNTVQTLMGYFSYSF
jgi:hypothetical protein